MKRAETQSNALEAPSSKTVRTRQHQDSPYQKVKDERKRPIRGLWKRNDRYYAQLSLEDEETGVKQVRRVPLEDVATVAQARQSWRSFWLPAAKRTWMVFSPS